MALSKAQISVLRHATEHSVFEADGKSLHSFLPYRGAAGLGVVAALMSRGYLSKEGKITLSGKGKLMCDPVASSERVPS